MHLIPADGEVSTYMKVEKVDGSIRYYRVQGGQHVELTEVQYLTETGVAL